MIAPVLAINQSLKIASCTTGTFSCRRPSESVAEQRVLTGRKDGLGDKQWRVLFDRPLQAMISA